MDKLWEEDLISVWGSADYNMEEYSVLYLGLRDNSLSVIFFAVTKLCSNLQCLYLFCALNFPVIATPGLMFSNL